MNLSTCSYPNNRLARHVPDLQALWGFVPTNSPAARTFEDVDRFHLHVDLPGVRKEDVKIQIEEGELRIEAVRHFGTAEKAEDITYHRAFSLPETVAAEKVTAEQKDGDLILTLPKKEEAKPRTVNINVN